jgi:tetratricopeptide (TPR) repeat protein
MMHFMSPSERRLLGSCLAVLSLAASVQAGAAVQESLPRGEIVERVLCQKDPDQSYALYLPSSYNPETPLPILYCFDPGARGSVPVDLFRDAAEDLNYIVVGSNNSRNGPWAPNLVAIRALLEDTGSRLALDIRRVYTAGMSGGGGPAWHVAVAGAAGTIICASAMDFKEKELRPISLCFFGVAGVADFNYESVFNHVETLRKLGKTARFETFEAGHSWPPKEVARTALEWLELQAIRCGLRAADEDFVEKQFRKDRIRASELESAGRLLEAQRAYESLVRDFDGLRDVTPCQANAARLSARKETREGRKRELDIAHRQVLEVRKLLEAKAVLETPAMGRLKQPDDFRQSVLDAEMELKDSISTLKDKMKKPFPDSERIIAQRVLDAFYIHMITNAGELIREKRYAPAIVNYELCSHIRPGSAGLLFELARAHAGCQEKGKAIEYLGKAVEAGFRDAEAIRQAVELQNLRGDERFKEIVSRLDAPH